MSTDAGNPAAESAGMEGPDAGSADTESLVAGGMGAGGLAGRQEALVRALVAGGPLPEGFDGTRVAAAGRALRNKRFGEVAGTWPQLLPYGELFRAWARDRPPRGSWRDGWDFARAHRCSLDAEALTALAVCEARWRYGDEPRLRRGPVVRRVPGGAVLGFWSRVVVLRPRR